MSSITIVTYYSAITCVILLQYVRRIEYFMEAVNKDDNKILYHLIPSNSDSISRFKQNSLLA